MSEGLPDTMTASPKDHPKVSYRDVAMKLLGGSPERLSLCIVQTPPPKLDAIIEDASRPEILSILAALLAPQGEPDRLRGYAGGNQPVLVLVPEYALSLHDWHQIDELVRNYGRPIVLIIGFGASKGSAVKAWRDTASAPTEKHVVAEEDILGQRTYNGGWCWIHRGPNGPSPQTECLTFLKNYPEQRTERPIIDGEGDFLLAVRFQDVLLFPTICADLIELTPTSIADRIHAAAEAHSARPVLVTCLNYEERPSHANWQAAIARLANTTKPHRQNTMVVLANHAIGRRDQDPDRDVWRSLTGIYSAWENGKERIAKDAGMRETEHSDFACHVFRRTSPSVLIGNLQWPPYGSGSGRFLWGNSAVLEIGEGRLWRKESFHDPAVYELHHFLGRHPPQSPIQAELAEALAHLDRCVTCGRCIKVSLLSGTFLSGLSTGNPDPHHDRLHEHDEPLRDALHTLAYLMGNISMPWRTSADQVGQLHWKDKETNVLVWRSKMKRADLENIAERWVGTPGDHPPLLIVADARGRIDPGAVKPDRRTDWTQPPADGKDNVTEVRTARRAWIYPMETVVEAFDAPASNIQDLIDKLKDVLTKEPEHP